MRNYQSIQKMLMFQILVLTLFLILGGLFLLSPAYAATTETQPSSDAGDAATAVTPTAGDPGIGRMFFTGERRFENGGPPCISCHNVGIGVLGGGALGPDLISSPNLKGGPAPTNPLLNSMWINNASTPVMGPIFSRKNITDDEVTHLKAFFTAIAEQPPASSATGTIVGIGAAGFAGMLVFFGITWSGRYRKRTGGTAHEAIWRNYGGKGGQR